MTRLALFGGAALCAALLAVTLGVAVPGARAVDFEKFQNCKQCIDAGFGWCPNMRRCGGFANNRCRGDVTDTRRAPADEAEYLKKVLGNQPQGGNRNAPPPPPPPQQQRQQQSSGGGGANPLAAGKLVEFSMGIEKHLTGHALKTQLIVFTSGVYSEETKPLKKAAKKLRSRALVVRIVAKDFRAVFERFGFKLGKTRLPQFAIADFSRDAGLEVYRRRDDTPRARKAVDLTPTRDGVAKVLAFMESFDKGELPLHVRSQPVPAGGHRFPAYPSGAVLHAVGDTLPRVANAPRYATLLFAHMPGCGHCKAFNDTFHALAPQFAMRVHFVAMDGTQNDVDHPLVTFKTGYPSIWFFGANGKANPTQHMERDRGKKAFAAWLNALLAKDAALKPLAKKRAGADVDDTVFADDDDDEDDDVEYVRPTPPTTPPPPPPAPKKEEPKKEEAPKKKAAKTEAPKKAAAAAVPDDNLWGPGDKLEL